MNNAILKHDIFGFIYKHKIQRFFVTGYKLIIHVNYAPGYCRKICIDMASNMNIDILRSRINYCLDILDKNKNAFSVINLIVDNSGNIIINEQDLL